VLGWLARQNRIPGIFAFSMNAGTLDYAHGCYAPKGKSSISAYGSHNVADDASALAKFAQQMNLRRYKCAALLRPGDYQLLLVDALELPKEELKGAMRWKIKDLIDYPAAEATLDTLDIPPPEGQNARTHMMFAVAARNELIQDTMRRCEQARVPLSVIDIPETAQRNIAALYETEARALGLIYFADDGGLLTVNFGGELYLARRFDVGLRQILAEASREAALERVTVEIQRTLDHFDRQFRTIPVTKILLAPSPGVDTVAELIKTRLGMETQQIDLREVLAFPDAGPDQQAQWRLFHHFGVALRYKSPAAAARRAA
jgi:MSHA biogenesis protein MshI